VNKRYLITGGTGSLGRALLAALLADPTTERVVIYSRDEVKQAEVAACYPDEPRLRLSLGDVRDEARVREGCWTCDTVIHAAALKRVDSVAHHPTEVLKTNLDGTRAVIAAAVAAGVKRVLLISSDKAVSPSNIYGISKAAAEAVAVASNGYGIPRGTAISAVRYGNVLGSRGSVVPVWRAAVAAGQPLKITDARMTRFWLTLPGAVGIIRRALAAMIGGEIFVPVLPSLLLIHLADALAPPGYPWVEDGVRPGGEKLAEVLLSEDEVPRTLARVDDVLYVVTPPPSHRTWSAVPYAGVPVDPTLVYRSDVNDWWLDVPTMRAMLAEVP
jgi:UDP-N-acetylglucosamine 4,6-dehydratase